jgi:hypothetical protein
LSKLLPRRISRQTIEAGKANYARFRLFFERIARKQLRSPGGDRQKPFLPISKLAAEGGGRHIISVRVSHSPDFHEFSHTRDGEPDRSDRTCHTIVGSVRLELHDLSPKMNIFIFCVDRPAQLHYLPTFSLNTQSCIWPT